MKFAKSLLRRDRIGFETLVLLCVLLWASPATCQEKTNDENHAAASPIAPDTDWIALPDGMPVLVKLTAPISSATAKVGDEVKLEVERSIVQDGLVILPSGMELRGTITTVKRARRKSRDGSVGLSLEKIQLVGGETTELRQQLDTSQKLGVGGTAKSIGQVALDPEFAGLGIVLVAMAGPVLLVEKGHEAVYPAGSYLTLYMNGPIRLSREAVRSAQPLNKEPTQIIYTTGGYSVVRTPSDTPAIAP